MTDRLRCDLWPVHTCDSFLMVWALSKRRMAIYAPFVFPTGRREERAGSWTISRSSLPPLSCTSFCAPAGPQPKNEAVNPEKTLILLEALSFKYIFRHGLMQVWKHQSFIKSLLCLLHHIFLLWRAGKRWNSWIMGELLSALAANKDHIKYLLHISLKACRSHYRVRVGLPPSKLRLVLFLDCQQIQLLQKKMDLIDQTFGPWRGRSDCMTDLVSVAYCPVMWHLMLLKTGWLCSWDVSLTHLMCFSSLNSKLVLCVKEPLAASAPASPSLSAGQGR